MVKNRMIKICNKLLPAFCTIKTPILNYSLSEINFFTDITYIIDTNLMLFILIIYLYL